MRHAWGTPDRPLVVMTCDCSGCLREVRRAPRVIVPGTPASPPAPPIRIMTTLHYCNIHHTAFDLADYWTDAIKARVESVARATRPFTWRPNFEAATTELVLTTTPEYRAFLAAIGIHEVAA